jgi:hypothetical protein
VEIALRKKLKKLVAICLLVFHFVVDSAVCGHPGNGLGGGHIEKCVD